MPKGLPSFRRLWNNYPTESSERVKEMIGGRVNATWITNTCTIRLSRAFNYAGDPIRRGVAGLNAVSGSDRKWYAFRVREMEAYLLHEYGAPQVQAQSTNEQELRGAVRGKRGIIQFKVRGWSDATGHLDLWNGTIVRYSAYFHMAHEVLLWECPA
jgi:hypothetical protein